MSPSLGVQPSELSAGPRVHNVPVALRPREPGR
jgi:hypothetical protein